MKLRQVPAGQGALWVRHGFRVFWQRPLAFCALFVVYMIAVQVLAMIWPVGGVAACAAVPIASLGFMIATHEALHGRFPTPGVFVQPFRRGRQPAWSQAKLALGYAVLMLGLGTLTWRIAGEAFAALEAAIVRGTTDPNMLAPLLLDPRLQTGLWVLLIGIAVLSVPFWHAPALVHWAAQGAGQSIFSSTLAVWRNKAALAMFTLTWGGVVMLFVIVVQLVFALIGQPQLATLALAPAVLMFATVYYVSLYFTFTDSFERTVPESAAPTPETPS